MKKRIKIAAWYGLGVFAPLAVLLSRDDECGCGPSIAIQVLMAAVMAMLLGVVYFAYGWVSARLRPLTLHKSAHYVALVAGLLYVPIIEGVIYTLRIASRYAPHITDDDFWGLGSMLVLMSLPALCFEFNRLLGRARAGRGE